MPPQHSPALLAWLKGPPLSIFLAIARNPGLGPSALSQLTGWGRGATYHALRQLAGVGWIERPYRGCWVLTGTGRIALWSLVGSPDAPPSRPRRRPTAHPDRGHPGPPQVSPSDTSIAFPEVSPSGTNKGAAAREISPDDTTTRFRVSPDDTSPAIQNPPEISADDTSRRPAAPP